MTLAGALAVTSVFVLVVIGLMVWGWARRTRRDSAIAAPLAEAPADAKLVATFPALYVATTRHDEPLERLAIKGLAFRSRADVRVTDAGVGIGLTGQPPMFLGIDRITAVGQSTVAIDRVVERDGLVCLSWRTDDGMVVDSYLRPQDTSARALADAVAAILPPTTQTGTDA